MITAFYVAPLAFILIVLSVKIIRIRRRERIGLGDGGNSELLKATRAHAHLCEFVPLLLIIMVLLELSNCHDIALHIYGVALVASRIFHAQGLLSTQGASNGRVAGMMITFFLLGLGSLGLVVLNIIDMMGL